LVDTRKTGRATTAALSERGYIYTEFTPGSRRRSISGLSLRRQRNRQGNDFLAGLGVGDTRESPEQFQIFGGRRDVRRLFPFCPGAVRRRTHWIGLEILEKRRRRLVEKFRYLSQPLRPDPARAALPFRQLSDTNAERVAEQFGAVPPEWSASSEFENRPDCLRVVALNSLAAIFRVILEICS